MLKNLIAEMARIGITQKDLSRALNTSEKTISNKVLCKTEFTRIEMITIKRTYFPELTLDYLFEQESQ